MKCNALLAALHFPLEITSEKVSHNDTCKTWPPFPDDTDFHSTSGLTSGFSEASLVSGVFKDGVQRGGKFTWLKSTV